MKFIPVYDNNIGGAFCVRGDPRGNRHTIQPKAVCEECGITIESIHAGDHMHAINGGGRKIVCILCDACADLYYDIWVFSKLVGA